MYFGNMFRKYERDARPGLVLATVAVVQFLVSLDLSVVNVGLPRIGAALGFSPVGLTWVIHAYALTFGGLLLLGGKAADRYGRRRVLLSGLGLFGLASLLGGFATGPGQLVAARAAQGSAPRRSPRPRWRCWRRRSPPARRASGPSGSGAR